MASLIKIEDVLSQVGGDPVALDYVLFQNSYPLIPHQRVIVRNLDNPEVMFVFLEAARGMSKSYVVARWCVQACIKNPGYKIVFSGPSFRQSQTPFRYAIDLIEENPLVKSFLAKEPTMSNVRWEAVWKNRSKMVALPASAEKLHGERANVIVFEEFFAYPEELHNKTVKPMLAVQSNRDIANKAIYVTSADFQFRWAYKRRADIKRMVDAGDSRYNFMSFIIDDMPPPEKGGFYSIDQLDDDKNSMPPDVFNQQYYNLWLSDSGTFYVLSVMSAPDLYRGQVELKGHATDTYTMGIDVARSLRGDGDDSAVSIWKVGEHNSLVYLNNFNGLTIDALGREIMRLLKLFPTTNRIVLDYGGGGVNLRDFFYKNGVVEIDEFDPSIPGRRILQRFPNTPEIITNAHYSLRGDFELQKIELPVAPEDGDEAKERVVKSIDETLHELANIEIKPLSSGFFKFDVPSNQKKDRAYALMYGHWACEQLKEKIRLEDTAALTSPDIDNLFDPLSLVGW